MTPEQITQNFAYHAPTGGKAAKHNQVREALRDVALLLTTLVPPSRELSTAITKLEESMVWANAGIARNPEWLSSEQLAEASQGIEKVLEGVGLECFEQRKDFNRSGEASDVLPLIKPEPGFALDEHGITRTVESILVYKLARALGNKYLTLDHAEYLANSLSDHSVVLLYNKHEVFKSGEGLFELSVNDLRELGGDTVLLRVFDSLLAGGEVQLGAHTLKLAHPVARAYARPSRYGHPLTAYEWADGVREQAAILAAEVAGPTSGVLGLTSSNVPVELTAPESAGPTGVTGCQAEKPATGLAHSVLAGLHGPDPLDDALGGLVTQLVDLFVVAVTTAASKGEPVLFPDLVAYFDTFVPVMGPAKAVRLGSNTGEVNGQLHVLDRWQFPNGVVVKAGYPGGLAASDAALGSRLAGNSVAFFEQGVAVVRQCVSELDSAIKQEISDGITELTSNLTGPGKDTARLVVPEGGAFSETEATIQFATGVSGPTGAGVEASGQATGADGGCATGPLCATGAYGVFPVSTREVSGATGVFGPSGPTEPEGVSQPCGPTGCAFCDNECAFGSPCRSCSCSITKLIEELTEKEGDVNDMYIYFGENWTAICSALWIVAAKTGDKELLGLIGELKEHSENDVNAMYCLFGDNWGRIRAALHKAASSEHL